MEYNFQIGSLVQYDGPPIVHPPHWGLIVKNNNGIVNLEEFAIIVEQDNFLSFATLYFQDCQLTIPRIAYRYLRLVV